MILQPQSNARDLLLELFEKSEFTEEQKKKAFADIEEIANVAVLDALVEGLSPEKKAELKALVAESDESEKSKRIAAFLKAMYDEGAIQSISMAAYRKVVESYVEEMAA